MSILLLILPESMKRVKYVCIRGSTLVNLYCCHKILSFRLQWLSLRIFYECEDQPMLKHFNIYVFICGACAPEYLGRFLSLEAYFADNVTTFPNTSVPHRDLLKCVNYHLPTKLQEGNVSSHVCLSFCPQGVPCDHYL